MSHNEKRGHWIKEGLLSFATGITYGVTVVAISHVDFRNKNQRIKFQKLIFLNYLKPFDTIKTKMQAQVGFESNGMYRTFIKIVKAQGIKGLYRFNFNL